MANDPVADAVAGAKKALSNANNFTQSVEGNPTSHFHTHQFSNASYSIPHSERKEPTVGDELKAKADNVKQYAESNKQ